jgi:hypothetical protein
MAFKNSGIAAILKDGTIVPMQPSWHSKHSLEFAAMA